MIMINKINASNNIVFTIVFSLDAYGGKNYEQLIVEIGDEEISIHQVSFVLSYTGDATQDSVETIIKAIANTLIDQRWTMNYLSFDIVYVVFVRFVIDFELPLSNDFRTLSIGQAGQYL
ncbi:MAG: hypothetical protein ACXV8U_16075 [Methylobacter sp.]